MRSVFIPAIIVIVTALSCNSKAGGPNPTTPETPRALQENHGDYKNSSSKRMPSDLVEDLYRELEKETPSLLQLAARIEDLKEERKDSLEVFSDFESKNAQYYKSADQHISSIRDSILKQRIRILIAKSMDRYDNKIAPHRQLIKVLNNNNLKLDDLFTVLKLTRTLGMMEEYQAAHFPSLLLVEPVNKKYEKLIAETDQLSQE